MKALRQMASRRAPLRALPILLPAVIGLAPLSAPSSVHAQAAAPATPQAAGDCDRAMAGAEKASALFVASGAAQRLPDCVYWLGMAYQEGGVLGGVEKAPQYGTVLLNGAADAGFGKAALKLADLAEGANNKADAFHLLERAKKMGATSLSDGSSIDAKLDDLEEQLASDEMDRRQRRMDELNSDIESQQHSADSSEEAAEEMINNSNATCYGPAAQLCQSLAQIAALKERQDAAAARNQAAADQRELNRLMSMPPPVVHHRVAATPG